MSEKPRCWCRYTTQIGSHSCSSIKKRYRYDFRTFDSNAISLRIEPSKSIGVEYIEAFGHRRTAGASKEAPVDKDKSPFKEELVAEDLRTYVEHEEPWRVDVLAGDEEREYERPNQESDRSRYEYLARWRIRCALYGNHC